MYIYNQVNPEHGGRDVAQGHLVHGEVCRSGSVGGEATSHVISVRVVGQKLDP